MAKGTQGNRAAGEAVQVMNRRAGLEGSVSQTAGEGDQTETDRPAAADCIESKCAWGKRERREAGF